MLIKFLFDNCVYVHCPTRENSFFVNLLVIVIIIIETIMIMNKFELIKIATV